ncbi:MAG: hypothetical protein IJD68_02025 [Ruminococcus sp.]|nr:hypothetical protein [Ruminococcus sp.]
MDFSNLQNYYLLKCFSEEKHREELNTGNKVYMKCLQYYHNLEDNFQRDFEGGIIKQVDWGKLILSKDNLTFKEAIQLAIEPSNSDQTIVIDTVKFEMSICGYISCFTLIPKIFVEFSDNQIIFNDKYDYKDNFYHFLNMYTDKYTYISVYEAQSFIEMFYRHMTKIGYEVYFDRVTYEDYTYEKRIRYYQKQQFNKLIFTKDNKFSYQREFRIFVKKYGQNSYDHIEEEGVDLKSSVVKEMVYLSPNYVKALKWDKLLDTHNS